MKKISSITYITDDNKFSIAKGTSDQFTFDFQADDLSISDLENLKDLLLEAISDVRGVKYIEVVQQQPSQPVRQVVPSQFAAEVY